MVRVGKGGGIKNGKEMKGCCKSFHPLYGDEVLIKTVPKIRGYKLLTYTLRDICYELKCLAIKNTNRENNAWNFHISY